MLCSRSEVGRTLLGGALLKAEQSLDLVPDREAEEKRVEEKSRKKNPVPLARAPPLTLVLDAGVPLRPLTSDSTLDRG
jgi:hypothetical protein